MGKEEGRHDFYEIDSRDIKPEELSRIFQVSHEEPVYAGTGRG